MINIPQYTYILRHIIVLAEVNNLHGVNLLKITPYNKCIVLKTIHAIWTHRKLVANKMMKIPLKNDQYHREIILQDNIIKIPYVLVS